MPDFIVTLSQTLQDSSLLYISYSVLLGLVVGSFLNVVIYRMPKIMEQQWQEQARQILTDDLAISTQQNQEKTTTYSLSKPRSSCPKCSHQITALENIPVISYLILGGKCSACKTKISMRYPLIELLTATLAGLVAYKFGYSFATFGALLFVFALITLTFIDFDTQYLPDDITLPLLWLGLIFNINQSFTDLASAVIGAVVGYIILWSVNALFKLYKGIDGMGYGDFKLLAAIGAWFGWQILPAVILLSAGVGAVIGICLMIFAKHGREVPIPFGPYLALGGISALFFGPQLASIYLIS